jgi:ClpP class serine protease
MPAWNDLIAEFGRQPSDDARAAWLPAKLGEALGGIRNRRRGRNVLFYASAFLQKPQAPAPALQLTHEEINGFMSCIYGMTWSDGLTLVLHTPGGVTNAAETIVAYLQSKFHDIEVIIPTYAMSAGTMISLASQRLIMGRQSQLGPIDPQMPLARGFVSARAIVDQFDRAKALGGHPNPAINRHLKTGH